jgi:hypothetical protein
VADVRVQNRGNMTAGTLQHGRFSQSMQCLLSQPWMQCVSQPCMDRRRPRMLTKEHGTEQMMSRRHSAHCTDVPGRHPDNTRSCASDRQAYRVATGGKIRLQTSSMQATYLADMHQGTLPAHDACQTTISC